MEDKKYVEEQSSISLVEIFETIKKYFWLLVATTLIGGLIAGSYAFFVATPKYRSTGAIMVQVKSGDEGNVNTIESQRLIQSTIDILTKVDLVPEVTSKAMFDKYFITIDKKKIKGNMSVSSSNNSLLIQINYIDPDPDNAKLILKEIINALISITDKESYNMTKTLKGNISNLYVSDAKYFSPNKLLYTFVGLILGGTVGLIGVFINEMINSGYKTKEELERDLKTQVLGEIPEFDLD